MNASQLHEFVVKEALQDGPSESPGDFYAELCEVFPLQRIKKKETHARALKILTKLSELLNAEKIEARGKKQILSYMDALAVLIEDYEKKAFAANLDDISGRDVLEYLMEEHSLRQSDLSKELGSQSVVSEILSGKRRLNSQQVLALSKRFGISPSAFFP
jgi:HTH-type transcriptional regulator/antitoxin HigA